MNTVKIQVPMTKSLRDKVTKRADELGFDSTQAMLRYVSKAIVDGRQVSFGEKDSWDEPSPEALARLDRWAKEARRDNKAGKLKGYHSVDELMKDLHSL